jgi:hypothetical protein
MRLSDAGLRCGQTKVIYPKHRPHSLAQRRHYPRDRSNRLLDEPSQCCNVSAKRANPNMPKINDAHTRNGTIANQKDICPKVIPPLRHRMSAGQAQRPMSGKSNRKKYTREWVEKPGSASVERNAIGKSQMGRKLRQLRFPIPSRVSRGMALRSSNDEVERRGAAQSHNEAGLSESSIRSLPHRRCYRVMARTDC